MCVVLREIIPHTRETKRQQNGGFSELAILARTHVADKCLRKMELSEVDGLFYIHVILVSHEYVDYRIMSSTR